MLFNLHYILRFLSLRTFRYGHKEGNEHQNHVPSGLFFVRLITILRSPSISSVPIHSFLLYNDINFIIIVQSHRYAAHQYRKGKVITQSQSNRPTRHSKSLNSRRRRQCSQANPDGRSRIPGLETRYAVRPYVRPSGLRARDTK